MLKKISLFTITSLLFFIPFLTHATDKVWIEHTYLGKNTIAGYANYSYALQYTISSDGNTIAAIGYGNSSLGNAVYGAYGVYSSTDGGSTWSQTNFPLRYSYTDSIDSIVGSANGQVLYVTTTYNTYKSTDGGASWATTTPIVSDVPWVNIIATSADGAKVFAIYGKKLYVSTDSATTWTAKPLPLTGNFDYIFSLRASSDGTKLIAISSANYKAVFSTDSGTTWQTVTDPNLAGARQVSISSDGSKYVVTNSTGVYTSANGTNWTKVIEPYTSNGYWSSNGLISQSSDGTVISIYDEQNRWLYTSTNGGTNWSTTTLPVIYTWLSSPIKDLRYTSDGSKLFCLGDYLMTYATSNQQMFFTNPLDSTATSSWPLAVTASTTVPVTGVTFYIDGVQQGNQITFAPYTFSWTPNYFGYHSVMAKAQLTAYDNALDIINWNQLSNGNHWVKRLNVSLNAARASVDGSKLVGTVSNNVYTSNNNGISWTQVTSLPPLRCHFTCPLGKYWYPAAISNDGLKLLVGDGSTSTVFRSTDGGNTWASSSPITSEWSDIWLSGDGQTAYMVDNNFNGLIYKSLDGGITWATSTIVSTPSGTHYWTALAVSNDGTKLVVTDGGHDNQGTPGYIYISTDGGLTWATSTSAGTQNWNSISMNIPTSTTKLIAASGNYIHISNDGGATWSTSTTPFTSKWTGAVGSADGTRLFISNYTGFNNSAIYQSTNNGTTWATTTVAGNSHNWNFITSWNDARNLVASDNTTGTYTYYDATTTLTAPVISNIATSVTSSSANITWTTDVPASSVVNYGTASGNYSTSVQQDQTTGVTNHSVMISGLPACVTYYYQISSSDPYENSGTAAEKIFTTAGCPGSSPVTFVAAAPISTSGGVVQLNSGRAAVVLAVPSSYAQSSATFQLNQLDTPTVVNAISTPGGLTSAGNFTYSMTALPTPTSTLSQFQAPLTVTIDYDGTDVSGLKNGTLTMYRYDAPTWTKLSNCSVDTNLHTVTCMTDHFSTFMLLGEPVPTQVTSTSGGGGGGSGYIPPSQNPLLNGTTTSATTTPVLTTATTTKIQAIAYIFTKNLTIGTKHDEVMLLQKYLNDHNFMITKTGAGSPGKETNLFGGLTKAALIKFQKAVGIKPASGYFGPLTRAYISNHP